MTNREYKKGPPTKEEQQQAKKELEEMYTAEYVLRQLQRQATTAGYQWTREQWRLHTNAVVKKLVRDHNYPQFLAKIAVKLYSAGVKIID